MHPCRSRSQQPKAGSCWKDRTNQPGIVPSPLGRNVARFLIMNFAILYSLYGRYPVSIVAFRPRIMPSPSPRTFGQRRVVEVELAEHTLA